MPTPLEQLSEKLGNPGVGALWLAVRKAGLPGVRKRDVEEFLRKKSEK